VLAGAGVLPLLAVTFPAALAALAVAAWLVRGKMALVPRMRGTDWWPLVLETLPYAAAVAVNTLYFRITIVVMSLVAVSEQTGYFATSFRVTEVLIGVPSLAIGAAFPILSRAARDDLDRFAYAGERVIELAVVGGIALALAVALSAPFVIELVAGPAGKPAAPVLEIQAIALAATFLTSAGGFLLLSMRRHMALLITNGGALVLNLVLTLILVHTDQAQGGAIAGVLAESALAVSLIALIARSHAVALRPGRLSAITLAGLAGAAPLLVSGLPSLIRLVAGLAIYAALLAAFRLMPPEIGHVLQRRRSSV